MAGFPAVFRMPSWHSRIVHVVGTTGLGADELEAAARLFADSTANAVVAANFAIGAVLLMRFCELAAPHMDGVEDFDTTCYGLSEIRTAVTHPSGSASSFKTASRTRSRSAEIPRDSCRKSTSARPSSRRRIKAFSR